MTLCIENLKDSIKKLLKLINKFGKVAGYKSVDNLLCFFTEITNYQKKKLWKNNSICNYIKKNKIPRNKCHQGGERFVNWNYNILMKETEEHKYMDSPCSLIIGSNIVQMFKTIYRFKAIPIKILMAFFIVIEQSWNLDGRTKAILRKMNKAKGIKFPDFKLYHKTLVIKTYRIDTKNIEIVQRVQKATHAYMVN